MTERFFDKRWAPFRGPLLLALCAVTLLACRAIGTEKVRTASLGTEVRLAPGGKAVFTPDNFEVRFVRVLEDSRCPADMVCVWAGQVKVLFAVQNTEQGLLEGQSTVVDQHRVTLVSVEPQPLSNRKVSPEQYRVTITVTAAAADARFHHKADRENALRGE